MKKIKEQLLKNIKKLRTKKGFIRAGYPRFFGLFGRDSLIVAWQLLDFWPEIAKNTLKILASLQGKKVDWEHEEEPGKILHEHYFGEKPKRVPFPVPYYGSVDSTPLFIILLGFYEEKTDGKALVQKLWPNVALALKWMRTYGDESKDGFLSYRRKNPKGLFNQGWKDSKFIEDWQPPIKIVEAQGYKFLALKTAARLQRTYGFKTPYDLESEAKILQEKFLEKFWWEGEKFFYLALDGKDKPWPVVTSNPGHLLFSGILKRDEAKAVVKRLFQKDMWTEYGIRTHSALDSNFDPMEYHNGSIWPHDNWIIAQGFRQYGFEKEYQMVKQALIRVHQALGYLPELYGVKDKEICEIPKANPIQAWSLGALLNFLKENDGFVRSKIKNKIGRRMPRGRLY